MRRHDLLPLRALPSAIALTAWVALLASPTLALAQPEPPTPAPAPDAAPTPSSEPAPASTAPASTAPPPAGDPSAAPLAPLPPPSEPAPAAPSAAPSAAPATATATTPPPDEHPAPIAPPATMPPGDIAPPPESHEDVEEPPSEGKMLVLAYNTGFQWSLSPGVVFAGGKAGFAFGARFGYGFEAGPVILVPGIEGTGYFLDPNVYVGMPIAKVVLPIDRFAPFVEGGAGVGHVTDPATTGLAVMGGVGFMVHPSASFAIGAEGTYQTILDTDFHGFSVGPIIAIAF